MVPDPQTTFDLPTSLTDEEQRVLLEMVLPGPEQMLEIGYGARRIPLWPAADHPWNRNAKIGDHLFSIDQGETNQRYISLEEALEHYPSVACKDRDGNYESQIHEFVVVGEFQRPISTKCIAVYDGTGKFLFSPAD